MRTAAPVEVTCTHSGYTQMQLKAMLYEWFLEVSKYPIHVWLPLLWALQDVL